MHHITDHKSLQPIYDQKQLNMRQRRWVELRNDYDCAIKYHPGKETTKRVWALQLTIHASLPYQIRNAQLKALKEANLKSYSLRGMDKQLEIK